MRLRFLVGAKMLEVVTRGGCVLLCTYTLPLVDSGIFGLMVAVVGLLAFLVGYERFIDIQRKVAGFSESLVHIEMRAAVKFFVFQYVAILPVALILILALTDWPLHHVLLLALIVVGEHIGNQAYLATLVNRKAYSFLFAAVAKNAIFLCAVLLGVLYYPDAFDIGWVVNAWGLASLCLMIAVVILWRIRLSQLEDIAESGASGMETILSQYRVSRVHFLVGIVAILAIQADRFVVGAILPAADVGAYFRNVTLAAVVMQLFSIIFYSRVAPEIFHLVREGQRARATQVIFAEYRRFVMGLALLSGFGWLANRILEDPAARLHVSEFFVTILVVGVAVRALADYFGLLLLSIKADGQVIANQALSLGLGLPCLIFGAAQFGLTGAVVGAVAMSLVLLGANYFQVRQKFSVKTKVL